MTHAALRARPQDAYANDLKADPATSADLSNRRLAMQLLHEHLARAHCQYRADEVRRNVRTGRLVAAIRAQRRAEAAAARARRLLTLAFVR